MLTTDATRLPLSTIRDVLAKAGNVVTVRNPDSNDEQWEQLILRKADGSEVASIERNIVAEESLGRAEIDEFEDELDDIVPQSSAVWLRQFFPRVRCIYSFQHLTGSHSEEGFAALQTVRNYIWARAEAIMQADGEGFTNEDGYQITWDFSEGVSGTWWMGVRSGSGWVHFQMDLANPKHREAFKNGRVPFGVTMA